MEGAGPDFLSLTWCAGVSFVHEVVAQWTLFLVLCAGAGIFLPSFVTEAIRNRWKQVRHSWPLNGLGVHSQISMLEFLDSMALPLQNGGIGSMPGSCHFMEFHLPAAWNTGDTSLNRSLLVV
ncbi:hypothetical protein Nepgr_023205 [Nepenthes gracilis]|uniref:Uncharacterized protein n=1 Tax=Nepenthes gracilis TaxID=150966 RepID=A0AAD3T0A8_NEPGR|nr:hypothetical protein Nepgr_023205 [Nepenthes gracilis]